ncbi:IclR family transcriptional regulator [Pseudaestuariivita rosea]|uniref:IclR family transcriptional regulator n=1 Tax=Pseudaestuariivita rosea TaxID=2763263 RepID=UPI001ABAB082|nr:IclR family transcriptional regulator [Pseudaestuariivita rosea]
MAEQIQKQGVEAVDRALALLDCFDEGASALGLADLARRSGLNKSTILRLSISLIRAGYLNRDNRGQFRLGPRTWQLGSLYRDTFRLPMELRAQLRTLSQSTGETASFYVRDGQRRICLLREEPIRAIRHALKEGVSLPLKDGASALVLRAFSSGDDAELGAIRTQGYAFSRGARDPDVGSLAVPVLRGHKLVGALTLSGPINRFDDARVAQILPVLLECSARIAKNLVLPDPEIGAALPIA